MMQNETPRDPVGSAVPVIATGVALVVLAPLPDLLGLGARRGFGTGQMLLVAFGLLLISAGLLLRSKRGRRWLWPGRKLLVDFYRLAAFSVFNLCLLIGGMEIVGTLIDRHTPLPNPEIYGAYYASQPWAQQYWREFEQVEKQMVYSPYTVWQSDVYQGQTLNIDERGIRHTPRPSAIDSGFETGFETDFETIFAFGGSAVWGQGAPDDGTVPALVQDQLTRELQRSFRVENLGERGHVATQSLIRLVLELQANRIPDQVIFHHGFNDVAVTLAAEVGGHFDTAHITYRLEEPFSTWLSSTRALSLFRPLLAARQSPTDSLNEDGLTRLATAIVDNYLGTYRLLEGLSDEYGFKFFCFWQPVRALSDDPRAVENRAANASQLDRLLDAAYEELERRAGHFERLDSLGNLLTGEDESVWVDQVHLTPLGNRIVAQAIVDSMRRHATPTEAARAE